jgi:ferrous iron transport protein A
VCFLHDHLEQSMDTMDIAISTENHEVIEVTTEPAVRGVMSLSELPAGHWARVISVKGQGAVARRLMEMGVVPGVSVKLIKTAPFGDPIEIKIRRYNLALRRNEANAVEVSV